MWKRPMTWFMLLPFFLPAYVLRMQVGPLPTTALELAIIALVIGWVCVRGKDGVRDAWERIKPWRMVMGLWLVAGIVSVVTAAVNGFDAIGALGLFRAYFVEPLVVFFIGCDVVRTEKDRNALLRSFAGVAVILTAWAVVQYATGWGIPHPWDAWPGRRATGPFPFPNALALFLVPFGAWAAALFVAQRDRLLAAILFGCAALSALLAQSDGGLIALGAACATALLFHKKTRAMTAAAIALMCFVTLVTPPLREVAEQKLLFKEWSGKVRTIIWTETTHMLRDRPVFGAGLGAYPQAILPYHTATWMEVFQYPHTIVLNFWTETGVLGVVVFTTILVVWVRSGRREIVIPIVLALLVHGLVDVPYFKNDLAVAFFLLMLATSFELHKTTVSQK